MPKRVLPSWVDNNDAIQRVTDYLLSHWSKAAAIRNADRSKVEALVETYLRGRTRKSPADIVRLLQQAPGAAPIQQALEAGVVGSLIEEAAVIEESVGVLAGSLSLPTPLAAAWANQHALNLAQYLTQQQEQTITSLLLRALNGTEPRNGLDLAPLILQSVDLTPQQAAWVANLHQRLTSRGVPQSRIDAEVDAFAGRLRRQRATTIGRTEINRALLHGRVMAWDQAEQDGWMTGMRKEWLTAPGCCDKPKGGCASLNGQSIGLHDEFSTPWGFVEGPQSGHPNCRCTVIVSSGFVDIDVLAGLKQGPLNLRKGDRPGHKFHGNQYTKVPGAAAAPEVDAMTLRRDKIVSRVMAYAKKRGATWEKKVSASVTDEQLRHAGEVIAEAIKDSSVHIRVDGAVLGRIFGDGRVMSQFETQRSGGMLDNKYRANAERAMFGYETDIPGFDRPIYGFLNHDDGYLSGSHGFALCNYGAIDLVLKPSVRSRTTFTVGDSLGGGSSERATWRLIPQPLDTEHPIAASGRDFTSIAEYEDWPKDRGTQAFGLGIDSEIADATDYLTRKHNYIEAQIHGGVTLQDIEKIVLIDPMEGHIPPEQAAIIDAGARHNIPVMYVDYFTGEMKPAAEWKPSNRINTLLDAGDIRRFRALAKHEVDGIPVAYRSADIVLYDVGNGMGRVMDHGSWREGPPLPIESILARGYWEAVLAKGEGPGHRFRGNQYTGGRPEGGASGIVGARRKREKGWYEPRPMSDADARFAKDAHHSVMFQELAAARMFLHGSDGSYKPRNEAERIMQMMRPDGIEHMDDAAFKWSAAAHVALRMMGDPAVRAGARDFVARHGNSVIGPIDPERNHDKAWQQGSLLLSISEGMTLSMKSIDDEVADLEQQKQRALAKKRRNNDPALREKVARTAAAYDDTIAHAKQRAADSVASWFDAADATTPEAQDALACYIFASWVQSKWATSAASITSNAVKMSVMRDSDHHEWEQRIDAGAKYGMASAQPSAAPNPEKLSSALSRRMYERNKALFDGYTDAVYAETQDVLARHGIAEMRLYRGVEVEPHEVAKINATFIMDPQHRGGPIQHNAVYEFASIMANSLPWQAVSDDPLVDRLHVDNLPVNIHADPLSSWSYDFDIARRFGGVAEDPARPLSDNMALLATAAHVPASAVWSTPYTGPGCRGEYEYILRDTDNQEVGVTAQVKYSTLADVRRVLAALRVNERRVSTGNKPVEISDSGMPVIHTASYLAQQGFAPTPELAINPTEAGLLEAYPWLAGPGAVMADGRTRRLVEDFSREVLHDVGWKANPNAHTSHYNTLYEWPNFVPEVEVMTDEERKRREQQYRERRAEYMADPTTADAAIEGAINDWVANGLHKADIAIYIDFPGLGGRDWPKRTVDIGAEPVAKGEGPGHPFRGNQWTGGIGGSALVGAVATKKPVLQSNRSRVKMPTKAERRAIYGDTVDKVVESIKGMFPNLAGNGYGICGFGASDDILFGPKYFKNVPFKLDTLTAIAAGLDVVSKQYPEQAAQVNHITGFFGGFAAEKARDYDRVYNPQPDEMLRYFVSTCLAWSGISHGGSKSMGGEMNFEGLRPNRGKKPVSDAKAFAVAVHEFGHIVHSYRVWQDTGHDASRIPLVTPRDPALESALEKDSQMHPDYYSATNTAELAAEEFAAEVLGPVKGPSQKRAEHTPWHSEVINYIVHGKRRATLRKARSDAATGIISIDPDHPLSFANLYAQEHEAEDEA